MRSGLVGILIFTIASSLQAQKNPQPGARAITTVNTPTSRLHYGTGNEPPRAIEFDNATVTSSHFVANINSYFSIPNQFTFEEIETNTDKLGMRHRLLRQFYQGIMIDGLGYRVHERNGFVTSANGRAVREFIRLDDQPKLNELSAFQRAVQLLQTRDTVFRPGKKLWVSKDFTFTPESFRLAYQFDIDVSLLEQWRVSVDAYSGEIINKVNLVHTCLEEKNARLPYGTATGQTRYYGNQTIQVETYEGSSWSRLVGQTEHGGKIGTYSFGNASIMAWFFDDYRVYDISSNDGIYRDKHGASVQWAAEKTFEYFFNKHDRNSFDNNGSSIISYVHVDQGWNNAAWSRNRLLFGDGSNNNPLVELDVVGHEVTHGVTQYEAGLAYYQEPGALNESFSDIFGKALEFSTFGDTATWQLSKNFRPGGLRDFSNPNLQNQPDTYQGDLWFTGWEDNGGVHYNSGVQNFWFYLLCEGGSGVNDQQTPYSVNAIGMDAAANIAYRNLTEYLDYYSEYLDSRIGSKLAAADLYGKNSTIYQEVDKAWDAVGVIDEPIITSLELYDITATTAKIRGSLQPRGDSVTYHFEYGTTPGFGSSTEEYQYTNTVQGIVTGLLPNTKYYLRIVASNVNGSGFYSQEFTTITLDPLVRIIQTGDVTETTAALYGEINPNSLATSYYFKYGQTPALGLETPTHSLPNDTEFLNVSLSVDDLQPRQTYYYKLVAVNGFSTVETETLSFFTSVKPVITAFTPRSANIGSEVTIHGQGFHSVADKNVAIFGATRASVISATANELKVLVPAGASFAAITVLDSESGLMAKSGQEFVPTFTGEFKKDELQLRVTITEPYVWRTHVTDMDGDGRPDIIGIHYQGFSVFQNVNQGGDITTESFVRNTFPVSDFYGSGGFHVIDFDGNGLKDVVGRSQKGIKIYPNLSVPGYIFFGVPVEVIFNDYVDDLVYDDFDSDGHIDIAGIAVNNNGFSVFRNKNPKGVLEANNFEKQYSMGFPPYVYFLTIGDLNKDGKSDLMWTDYNSGYLRMFKNNSAPGYFAFENDSIPDATRGRFVRYVSHDLNQDSWFDVISHSPYETGNLAVFDNQKSSGAIKLTDPMVVMSGNKQSTAVPADINGDGKLDIVAGLSNRKFVFLKNKTNDDEPFTGSSFEQFSEYGLPMIYTGDTDFRMTISDLNGDGRPEIINQYSYNFGPHDPYQMEIWQNAPNPCIDPTSVTASVNNSVATLVLPANTTFDQYEVQYEVNGSSYWNTLYSNSLSIWNSYTYKIRIRAKCFLGFTDYHYIEVRPDCVPTSDFRITGITNNQVYLNAIYLNWMEIEYSLAGKNEWTTLPLYASQIYNLLPGTRYDLRYRARCDWPTHFKYLQFTTQCPGLGSIYTIDIAYNRAVLGVGSIVEGVPPSLEYSLNNTDWMPVDENLTMYPLMPGTKYYVRGRNVCTNAQSTFVTHTFKTPCPAVSNVQANSITPYSASISWDDESATGTYTLMYRATIGGGGPTTTVTSNTTSFNLKDLAPGTEYSVSVAPDCQSTRIFAAIKFSTICFVPYNIVANNVDQTSAEISWESDYNGSPYWIDYTILGSNEWLSKQVTGTNKTLTNLRPGTAYEARVHITCLSETPGYNAALFTTNLYDEISIAPNPTTWNITIFPSRDLIGTQFTIHDNRGRIVANDRLMQYSLDLSLLAPGVYTLKIEGEKPIRIVKI